VISRKKKKNKDEKKETIKEAGNLGEPQAKKGERERQRWDSQPREGFINKH